jgi:lycopene cyclase domain-containing protein
VTYTFAALLGVAGAFAVDLVVLRTMLVRRRAFWVAYAIVLAGQLMLNGMLTGLGIVDYRASVITGWRLVYAPVEDLLFGFAMVLCTLSLWVWQGRRAARATRPAPRTAPPRRDASGLPGGGR